MNIIAVGTIRAMFSASCPARQLHLCLLAHCVPSATRPHGDGTHLKIDLPAAFDKPGGNDLATKVRGVLALSMPSDVTPIWCGPLIALRQFPWPPAALKPSWPRSRRQTRTSVRLTAKSTTP